MKARKIEGLRINVVEGHLKDFELPLGSEESERVVVRSNWLQDRHEWERVIVDA